MASLYKKWAEKGYCFHYVSSSNWQLYKELNAFLMNEGFPSSAYHLKKIRLTNKTVLKFLEKGSETKPKQIIPILNKWPAHKFILIGDSGEQDPKVYSSLARKYPEKIYRIYIHPCQLKF